MKKVIYFLLMALLFCESSFIDLENQQKQPEPQQNKAHPNIIYIIADQLRHDILGYAGDYKALTPNIDQLAAQSMNFSNCVSISPVCAPYRASLIMGKYTSTPCRSGETRIYSAPRGPASPS